jgi:glutamate synthase (NADPH/NADH) large chain
LPTFLSRTQVKIDGFLNRDIIIINSQQRGTQNMLYNADLSQDSCGVGFITHKRSQQTHDILLKTNEALCSIPHRGGMSAEGIGDGAGVNIDLSLKFFRKITANPELELGQFGVANFFFPTDHLHYDTEARVLIEAQLEKFNLPIILWRNVPVDNKVINLAAVKVQFPIKQLIFARPKHLKTATADEFEQHIQQVLLAIKSEGFTRDNLQGFYPLSMSSRTQVYKARLNSNEVIRYFTDLYDPDHEISTLFFHTRFSTNTAPATMMAQPFHYLAHNGELNTDKKNRLSENAIARQQHKTVLFPEGQSDSGRLDQTLTRRINEDHLDIVTAILAMMPPAWENDHSLPEDVRAMLAYFSLYEEKNDGPAAIIFNDGIRVGARLDRLGLRPLRTVETDDYLVVMSEAGQINFPADQVLKRGRIKAGGMLYFNHQTHKAYDDLAVMSQLAKEKDYAALLAKRCVYLSHLETIELSAISNQHVFSIEQQHTAYSLNQESFKFLLDPMLQNGLEKVSAMGYGLTPNALAKAEGGMSRYFNQRFAQVTNPPLDSLRESDGMTLRVALGGKPNFVTVDSQQLMLDSPILQRSQLLQICQQSSIAVKTVEMLYLPDFDDKDANANNLEQALLTSCDQVEQAARNNIGIIILSDLKISSKQAAIPALLMISAANQRLVQRGLRFNSSLIAETGQAVSSHDVATILGFGASAICPLSVHNRVMSLYSADTQQQALDNFYKAANKSLMKTMGKFGLCTAESYIGGEFFESNYLDTNEPKLTAYFPNIHASVGGVQYIDIASSATEWHQRALNIKTETDIPFLGLFKERQHGSAHSFGNAAVRGYIDMTDEAILYIPQQSSPIAQDTAYNDFGYNLRTPEQIDTFGITPAYRSFTRNLYLEREGRPAALRDVAELPADITQAITVADFECILTKQNLRGNNNYLIRGLKVTVQTDAHFKITLTNNNNPQRLQALLTYFENRFESNRFQALIQTDAITLTVINNDLLTHYLSTIKVSRAAIKLDQVQPAHQITATLASGAMSHGALLAEAHEAVALGTNIVGASSNSGEGGEHSSRFGTLKSCKIKQFASGRFGIWAGYLADSTCKEIEIKIAQGAKPGEGGQLPAMKVSVEIASLRGGTPKVELVSPPPHHDTYSIEDLGQLIHDAKAARVKVVVKLVSSEGIGTIAVGVAKAGADIINVAGNSGGTGAAAVTSLKHAGRSAEIGIAEVHQALAVNGLRDKITLRCSGAHQSGLDVVKSAILGADSFEFGTTALMMLRCVMAKNCNVKCPAGLTTAHEEFKGDARVLAQYFMNLAHEVREILADLGYHSLLEIRGQADLLHLIDHPLMVGQLDFTDLLAQVIAVKINQPIYLEADFSIDDQLIKQIKTHLIDENKSQVIIEGDELNLTNRHKTVGGQTAIDIERLLHYQLTDEQRTNCAIIHTHPNGRYYFADESIVIRTQGSAGQSYAAFLNNGMRLEHTGTCNDGIGKTMCGGTLIVKSPGGGSSAPGGNVLIGNFALFGASGGKAFINGEGGDRFAVRNSGAMAVIEGIGDFGCEYMINGAVLNLGGFGKGFCTGMSGGNAYQYDPDNLLTEVYDKTSVEIHSLNENTEISTIHEPFILTMLEQHLDHTGSEKARFLLANWPTERQHFFIAMPVWLYKTQTATFLQQTFERKAMIEELAIALAQQQIAEVKQAYQQNKALFKGDIPSLSDTDKSLTFKLINHFSVIHTADKLATDTVKLITERPRKLQDALVKNNRVAYDHYQDHQLASWLAEKRLGDYKTALSNRDVQSIYSLGTTAWIIEQDKVNQQALKGLTSVDEYLANQISLEIVESMLVD